jgi:hypothetical protein
MRTVRRLAFLLSAVFLACQAGILPAPAASETGKAELPGANEIQTKRSAVRDQLMLPSLVGIRGLAFNVVGFKDGEKAEKQLGEKLKQVAVPVYAFGELKEGSSTVDAMLHIHFIKMGNYAVCELALHQWVSLLRSPRTKLRAITYRNRVFVPITGGDQAISELADQFVADFKKANKK